jgi:hypothetical protein
MRCPFATLKQLVDLHGRRDKLWQKLLERARREAREPAVSPRARELAQLQSRRVDLQSQRATIEYRMARERDDALYTALSRQYQAAQAELAAVEEAVRRQEAEQATAEGRSPEAQAEAALALLDDVARITADPTAWAEVNPLLKRLGLWIGLTFRPAIKGTKRVVQQLASGRIVFGDGPLPVPLFGKDHVDDGPRRCGNTSPLQGATAEDGELDQKEPSASASAGGTAASAVLDANSREKKQAAGAGMVPVPAAVLGDRTPDRLNSSQPEGISITKVRRGDRRWTFPNEPSGQLLLWQACAQALGFAAESFFRLGTGR